MLTYVLPTSHGQVPKDLLPSSGQQVVRAGTVKVTGETPSDRDRVTAAARKEGLPVKTATGRATVICA